MTAERPVILLVDDEEQIRTGLQDCLEDIGFSVIAVESGDKALSLIASNLVIDLIITDVVMPGNASGFDVVEYARASRPDIRAIVMSGYMGNDYHRVEAADRFLQKPFTFMALERTINEAVITKAV